MTPEVTLMRILPAVEALLKETVNGALSAEAPTTLYALEAQTQRVLPRIGQVVLQALASAQGSGLAGPTRLCGCGEQQHYHDQARPLSVQTSVGEIRLRVRAYYRCGACGATSYPLDEQLGLGLAGRMSRYLQEQCGWLLALLPGRVGCATLERFGWPAISPSHLRVQAEALGEELDQLQQARVAQLQAAVAGPTTHVALRQPAQSSRVYAAPDGLKYCTTERDPQTGKLVWREFKAAAVYEGDPQAVVVTPTRPGHRPPLRQRLQDWLATPTSTETMLLADHAVRITYVAQTGSYAQFGQALWAELYERGVGTTVSDLAVVADGSPHLDGVVDRELRVPGVQVTRILDQPHAQAHLWAVSKTVFGEGSPAGVRWVQAPLQALDRGQVDLVCAALEDLACAHAARTPEGADKARKAATYFADRAAQLAYPTFLAQGYQVGSGLAESACKRFGTDRMKGAGMRWTIPGAQQVATLRMLLLSDRWQEVSALCSNTA
jgi:hypothetical protein